MKKLLIVLAVVVMVFSVVSCGKNNVEIDLAAVKSDIVAGNLFLDELIQLDDNIIESKVGLDLSLVKSGEFWMGVGMTGEEYGVFECNSADDAKKLATQLETHLEELYATYKSYESHAPGAVDRIEEATVRQAGVYVAYVSADKYTEAAKILDTYF